MSVSHSLSVTPWTVAHQAPLSMGLSRQEYWSGLLFPPPGDYPDPGLLHCRHTLYCLGHQGRPGVGYEEEQILKFEEMDRDQKISQ